MGHDVIKAALALACTFALLQAEACEYPDEGNMPLRRAVSRVQQHTHKYGHDVKYAVLLEANVRVNGVCYWTVEMREAGKPARRFYVSPDGKKVLAGGKLLPARE